VENLARYVDKEEKTEIELIIRVYLVEWISQVANTASPTPLLNYQVYVKKAAYRSVYPI